MTRRMSEFSKAAFILMMGIVFMLFAMFYAVDRAWCLDTWSVSKIAPQLSTWSGTNYVVPGLVQGVKTGVSVAEWGALQVTPAIGASMLSRVALAGGVMGAAYLGTKLIDYLGDKALTYLSGELKKQIPGTYTFSDSVKNSLGLTSDNQIASSTLVENMTPNFTCSCGTPVYGSGWGLYANYNGSGHMIYVKQATCQGCYNVSQYNAYAPGIENDSYLGSNGSPTYQAATQSDVETATSDALTNGEPKAKDALEDVMKKVSEAIDSPADALTVASPTTVESLKTDLKSAVTDVQKTSMDTASTANDAQKTYGQAASGTSKTDIKSALKETLDDGVAVTGPALSGETIPSLPEKVTITSILTTWWAGFQQLPIVSLFTGMSVTASGSPILSFTIPGFMGGSSTSFSYDFSQHESVWSFMGNILLMLTGITWTIYIFEG